jgi:hypothetical protein
MSDRARGTFEADLHVDERLYTRYEQAYLLLASAFSVLLVLTNVVGTKLFTAPLYDAASTLLFFLPKDNNGFALTTGILTYPLTFLITDLVSEVYGKKRADFMVLIGFLMSLLMLAVTQASMWVPAHPYWVPPGDAAFYPTLGEYQKAFESVFSLNGVLLIGSMLAYAAAQFTDNWLFHFWKRLTRGRHLWLRNNGSTIVSQLVDTAIVNSILFYLGFGWDFWQGVQVMLVIYCYKVVIALLDTPFIYLGVWLFRWLVPDPERPVAEVRA